MQDPARAQAGDAVKLPEITVTGEKTLRLFEDTASSVSVLTDEELEERPRPRDP